MIELDFIAPADYSRANAGRAHVERRARMEARAVADDGILSPHEWWARQREKRAEASAVRRRASEAEASRAIAQAKKEFRAEWEAALHYQHPCTRIKRAVAAYFGVTWADLEGPRRWKKFVRPRQIAMYLARTLTPHSLPEIARHFGGRDHTTVLHAVRKIEALRAADPALDERITRMKIAIGMSLAAAATTARAEDGA